MVRLFTLKMTTQAIPPDRILRYLLGKDDDVLKGDNKLVIYQKDLNLAINVLEDNNKVLSEAMKKLPTLLSVVTIFPSESYIPTEEEVKELREVVK